MHAQNRVPIPDSFHEVDKFVNPWWYNLLLKPHLEASSPSNTQMDGATLLTLQGPMGLGHLISRHLHRRVHPLRGRLPTQRAGPKAGPTIQQC